MNLVTQVPILDEAVCISHSTNTLGDGTNPAISHLQLPMGKLYTRLDLTFICPRGVMVKAMHCGIVVREFVLQSRYYIHFRANTLGKGMNPLILPPAMGK